MVIVSHREVFYSADKSVRNDQELAHFFSLNLPRLGQRNSGCHGNAGLGSLQLVLIDILC